MTPSRLRVRDVCAALEDLAPPGLASEWDRAGLNLGDPEAPVSRVLATLTVTTPAFRAARRAAAQMIVSHHPLFWEPLSSLRSDRRPVRLCLDIAKAGIACFSAHSNLDAAPGGVNDVLVDRLGLLDARPLLPLAQAKQVKLATFVPESHLARVREAVCEAGAGVIGDYTYCTFSASGVGTFLPGKESVPFAGRRGRLNEEPERRFEVVVLEARLPRVLEALFQAHPYEEVAYDVVPLMNPDPTVGLGRRGRLKAPMPLAAFASYVRARLKAPHVRYVGNPKRRVQSVAVLAGAAGSHIEEIPQEIEALVTGDLRYHDGLHAEERGLALVDAGHDATERWIVPVLARHLRKRLPVLKVSTYLQAEPFRLATG